MGSVYISPPFTSIDCLNTSLISIKLAGTAIHVCWQITYMINLIVFKSEILYHYFETLFLIAISAISNRLSPSTALFYYVRVPHKVGVFLTEEVDAFERELGWC